MAKMRGASPSDDTELISAPNTKGTITQVCGSIIKELNTEILLLSKFSHYELYTFGEKILHYFPFTT